MGDIQQREAQELDARDRELADKVAAATFAQIELKYKQDMQVLEKDFLPSKDREAREAALDMRYLQNRQQILGHQITVWRAWS